ncbi:hypothetical protein N0V83_004329 [Neocucurbitaria cava]|uniref:NmrA-like domain-containing protein n=1 Tax=Neocucurbitaria cava TaxID=798079 RepID=A0A9W9CME3_9PLEO|nr:hypothetical protein N0V83_004329 [Neocucurbitaria cava]
MSEPGNHQTSPPTRILLLGAGELGTALLTSLSSLPSTRYSITLAVRTPQNTPTSSLLPQHLPLSPSTTPNITLRTIDLSADSTHLASIFSHYDILISATGFGQTPESILKLAHEVLLAGELRKKYGGDKLWFFPWQWGVNYDITLDCAGMMPLFGAQKEVRDLLRSSATEANVKWTIVSTGIFMSFLFEPFWGIVDRSRVKEGEGEGKGEDGKVVVRCLRDWNHGVTVTHVGDIGTILARIVHGDIDADDKVLYTSGSTVRYGELADLIERISGLPVQRETWDIPHLQEEVRRDPEDGIKKYRLVFAGEGVSWGKEGTVNEMLGVEMMTVERYVEGLFGGGGGEKEGRREAE